MRPCPNLAALLTCLVVTLPAGAVTIVLDPMTDPLPPNPCLPVSMQPVLFTGRFCDGPACPPGSLVGPCPGSQSSGEQLGLVGVGPTIARNVYLNFMGPFGGDAPPASARIRPDVARLELLNPEGAESGEISCRYDGGVGWDFSPAALGATEVRITVGGAISPDRPLSCYVLLEDVGDRSEESVELFATQTVELTGPGDFVLPFSAFEADPGFDLNGLDWIVIEFGGCRLDCQNNVPMPSFTAGPIRFETGAPVAAKKRSWGQLKTGYR